MNDEIESYPKIPLGKSKDLTGQKFGKLTALYRTKNSSQNRKALWLCQCDCGNYTTVISSNLTRENGTRSCGCYLTERNNEIRAINLVGQRFGRLTAIERIAEKNKTTYYKCVCDCGNTTIVAGTHLKRGETQSCGCQKSKGEDKICRILTENNILFERQKTFDSCKFDNGYSAYFDFFLPEFNCLIEYDGIIHFEYSNRGWDTKNRFLKTLKNDEYKNNWCKENNYTIIRIPYTDYDILNKEYIISRITQGE